MIERFFYETLGDELKKRGFFIATDYAPEHCVGICGINGRKKCARYVEYLQENYRLAAIKNVIFSIGNTGGGGECVGGWYEVLVGSRTKEPFPMVFVTLKNNERYYKMAYQCRHITDFVDDNYGKEATRYIVECVKFMTSSLMDVLHEWIMEGKFPLHRFGEGMEGLITE